MIQTGQHPGRFVVDGKGRKVGVLLGLDEYSEILEELEELESIRAYDAAKACGEEPIPFESAAAGSPQTGWSTAHSPTSAPPPVRS